MSQHFVYNFYCNCCGAHRRIGTSVAEIRNAQKLLENFGWFRTINEKGKPRIFCCKKCRTEFKEPEADEHQTR